MADGQAGGVLIILVILGVMYFLPTIVAVKRNHSSMGAIALLNILAGWTLLGWLAAIVWAAAAFQEKPSSNRAVEKESVVKGRVCPYCAEEIQAEAVLCKHCRSDLSQASR